MAHSQTRKLTKNKYHKIWLLPYRKSRKRFETREGSQWLNTGYYHLWNQLELVITN